jgi:hypothetical protein
MSRKYPERAKAGAAALLCSALLALGFGRRGACRLILDRFGRFGLSQSPQALHILPDGNAVLLDISHRLHAFARGNALAIRSRDAFGRWFAQFLVSHVPPRFQT